jgi:hypothetical protein
VRDFCLEPIFQRGLFGRTLVVLCRGLFMFVFCTDLHLFRRIGYDDALMDGGLQQALALSINNGFCCPMIAHSSLEYTLSLVIPAGRWGRAIQNEDQMDARLLMSGMTMIKDGFRTRSTKEILLSNAYSTWAQIFRRGLRMTIWIGHRLFVQCQNGEIYIFPA